MGKGLEADLAFSVRVCLPNPLGNVKQQRSEGPLIEIQCGREENATLYTASLKDSFTDRDQWKRNA
jgi:hypothetical protein